MDAQTAERDRAQQKKGLAARLRERKVATIIGVVAIVAAIVVGLTTWLASEGTTTVDTDEGPARIINRAGGYSLVAPQGWDVTVEGRTTTIVGPNDAAVLSVGLGETGTLEDAAALFFQQVARNYDNFQPLSVDGQRIGGRPALLWAGRGTNDSGRDVRFLAITVENRPRHFAITYFTADGQGGQAVVPQLASMLESFRSLRG